MKTLALCLSACASLACSASQPAARTPTLPPPALVAAADAGTRVDDVPVVIQVVSNPPVPRADGPSTTGPLTGEGPFTVGLYSDPGAGASNTRVIVYRARKPVRAFFIGGANSDRSVPYEQLAGRRTPDVVMALAHVPEGQVSTGAGTVIRVIQRGTLLIIQEGESIRHRVRQWTDRYTQEIPAGETVTQIHDEPPYEEVDAWVRSPVDAEPPGG